MEPEISPLNDEEQMIGFKVRSDWKFRKITW